MKWIPFNIKEIKVGDNVSLEVPDGRGHHISWEGIVEVINPYFIDLALEEDGLTFCVETKRIRRMKVFK